MYKRLAATPEIDRLSPMLVESDTDKFTHNFSEIQLSALYQLMKLVGDELFHRLSRHPSLGTFLDQFKDNALGVDVPRWVQLIIGKGFGKDPHGYYSIHTPTDRGAALGLTHENFKPATAGGAYPSLESSTKILCIADMANARRSKATLWLPIGVDPSKPPSRWDCLSYPDVVEYLDTVKTKYSLNDQQIAQILCVPTANDVASQFNELATQRDNEADEMTPEIRQKDCLTLQNIAFLHRSWEPARHFSAWVPLLVADYLAKTDPNVSLISDALACKGRFSVMSPQGAAQKQDQSLGRSLRANNIGNIAHYVMTSCHTEDHPLQPLATAFSEFLRTFPDPPESPEEDPDSAESSDEDPNVWDNDKMSALKSTFMTTPEAIRLIHELVTFTAQEYDVELPDKTADGTINFLHKHRKLLTPELIFQYLAHNHCSDTQLCGIITTLHSRLEEQSPDFNLDDLALYHDLCQSLLTTPKLTETYPATCSSAPFQQHMGIIHTHITQCITHLHNDDLTESDKKPIFHALRPFIEFMTSEQIQSHIDHHITKFNNSDLVSDIKQALFQRLLPFSPHFTVAQMRTFIDAAINSYGPYYGVHNQFTYDTSSEDFTPIVVRLRALGLEDVALNAALTEENDRGTPQQSILRLLKESGLDVSGIEVFEKALATGSLTCVVNACNVFKSELTSENTSDFIQDDLQATHPEIHTYLQTKGLIDMDMSDSDDVGSGDIGSGDVGSDDVDSGCSDDLDSPDGADTGRPMSMSPPPTI